MGHGGKRSGAGRPKGSVKMRTQIDEFNLISNAQEYSKEMLGELVDLVRNSTNESIRLSAATQILDRAHGKPGQMKMPDPNDHSAELSDLFREYLANPLMNYDAPLMGREPMP